jgi:hypothetical protein
MPASRRKKVDRTSPEQRQDEIAILLATAIVRLHQRTALPPPKSSRHTPQIRLDSAGQMPLSVSGRRHNG